MELGFSHRIFRVPSKGLSFKLCPPPVPVSSAARGPPRSTGSQLTQLTFKMPNNLPDYRDINPFGDVRLCVKSSDSDSSCDFRVSSHQLVAISHFFRQLLGPESQFNEAVDFRAHREPTTPYHLPLDLEDHPLEVCESILRILHGKPPVKDINFNTGEGEPSDLLQIIKLSNYFGCGEALGVWVKLVIPISLNKRDGEYDEKIEELTKWLSVAFAFRLENAFRIVTRFCIQHGRRKAMEAKFEVGGVAVVKGEYLEFYRLGNTPRKVVSE